MATSNSLGEFGRRLTLIGRGIRSEAERTIRKAALRTDQVAVLATPVDTGRARANWIASILTPSDRDDRPPDGSGNDAMLQAAAVVGAYKLELGAIYLTNNVEYIVPLENGSSRQAPHGMAKQAVAAGADVVRNSKLMKG